MKEYPFRLLCKRCNSYRFTTISQFPRQGMLYNHIELKCLRCDVRIMITEEPFDTEKKDGS